MIGRTLSHFKILAKIGEGGMGVVYRAEDEKLRRPVALKVLPPDLVANEERRLRFLREARTAAAINHPNIAHVYEVDEADGVVFIAMELVEGKTLREVMGGKPMSIKDTLRIATEMSEGLAKAHQAHVIHRDLKPENVIVTAEGHVKILDFGLAKLLHEHSAESATELSKLSTISEELTIQGKIFGTVAYMSPEQARGQTVDARSDLFSFGTTLYEMITGRVPFQGKTATDTLSSITRDEPTPPSQLNDTVPQELDRIVAGCLEKDPQDRYQHTDQLAVDLRKLKRSTDSGVQPVRTPSGPVGVASAPRSAAVRWLKRHPNLAASLGVALVVAAVGTWRATRTSGAIARGDRIIVADFLNSTGQVEYETAIRDAFEHMLSGSTFVEVLHGEDLRSLVKAKTGTTAARVDTDLARRLCADGGCTGFFTGRTELDGSTPRISVVLNPVAINAPAITRSASVASDSEILEVIHDLVLGIRRDLGETPRAVACTSPPTTRSLEAYQAYALAEGADVKGVKAAITLYKDALDLDEGFVEAYSGLSDWYGALGDWQNSHRFAEEAYRRSAGLSSPARLLNEVRFLRASHDYDTAVERLESYIRLCPFDFTAHSKLGGYVLLARKPCSGGDALSGEPGLAAGKGPCPGPML